MGLIEEFNLSVFLPISLLSMQLWTLAEHTSVLAVTIVLQAGAATLFIAFVVFRAMGRGL
ncbi:MAG TPA: sodium/glutamate symporter [Roseovarius sp.]